MSERNHFRWDLVIYEIIPKLRRRQVCTVEHVLRIVVHYGPVAGL